MYLQSETLPSPGTGAPTPAVPPRLAPDGALSNYRRRPWTRSVTPLTLGLRSGLLAGHPVSPVSSGANFSRLFPGRASSLRPRLPGGCPPLTPLRPSLCLSVCGVLYPRPRICQVSLREVPEPPMVINPLSSIHYRESAYLTQVPLCARLPFGRVGG